MTQAIAGIPNGVIWFERNPDGSKSEMACAINAATADVLAKGLDLAEKQLARAQKNKRKGTSAAQTVADLTQLLTDVRAGSYATVGDMLKARTFQRIEDIPPGESGYVLVPADQHRQR